VENTRVYVDTSAFREEQWPRLSANMESLFRLTAEQRMDIVLLEPVEAELEAHVTREIRERLRDVAKAIEALDEIRRMVGAEAGMPLRSSEDELLKAYHAAAGKFKSTHQILPGAITQRELKDFFRMAINYEAPFKTKEGKEGGGGGEGFQDAVIMHSCIEDLKKSPEHKGIFITRDKEFERRKGEIIDYARSAGVDLTLCPSVKKLVEDLSKQVAQRERNEWDRDRERIRQNFEARRSEINAYVRDNLRLPVVRAENWVWRVTAILGADARIDGVDTPPPTIRKPGERVPVTVYLTAMLQVHALPALPSGFSLGTGGITVFPQFHNVTQQIRLDASVAPNRQGVYRDVKYESITPLDYDMVSILRSPSDAQEKAESVPASEMTEKAL
jgi:hypothetical protein